MKVFYVTLLLMLFVSLMVLEITSSRVPAPPLTPARVRDAPPRLSPVSGG